MTLERRKVRLDTRIYNKSLYIIDCCDNKELWIMQLSWIASSYGLWQYLTSVKRLLISNTVNFADCLFRRQLYKQLALYSSMRTAKISKCCTFAGIRLRITWASMVWHRSEYKVKHSVRPLGQTNPKIQLFTFFCPDSMLYYLTIFSSPPKKNCQICCYLCRKSPLGCASCTK